MYWKVCFIKRLTNFQKFTNKIRSARQFNKTLMLTLRNWRYSNLQISLLQIREFAFYLFC